MRVIQILPELDAGGVERGTLELGQYLVEQGHESVVISNGGRLVRQLEAEGSRHIALPVHKKRLASLKQVKVLRRLFEQEKPDILHLRSRLPAWLAWLAWRKMDPANRPRLVTTVHGFYSVNAYSAIMTKGERVICVSNSVKDYVLKNYPKVQDDKLTVIHRGVDPLVFPRGHQPPEDWLTQWKFDYPELEGKYVVTLPGRITRLKGHEDFIQIIKELASNPHIHGLIVGGASNRKLEYFDEIKALVHDSGLENNITFTGHRSDLREILACSNAVLSLTQQPESFGRTTLESLYLGTPVIGYDYGGVGEILRECFPAGKVTSGNISAVVAKLREWATHPISPDPCRCFKLEDMLRGTLQTYGQITSLNGPWQSEVINQNAEND